jgi:hypothetical protein
MASRILVFDKLAYDPAANQWFQLIFIDNVGSFNLFIKDVPAPTNPSLASQISSVGATPVIAPSGVGNVNGVGTTGNITLWTDGPNSVIGDSVLTQAAGSLVQPTGNYTITLGNLALGAGTISFPDNVRQTFNPGANNPGLNVGSNAGDPSTPANGDLWYDSTGNLLRARVNGATITLSAVPAAGANTALSNLAAVAINTDLIGAVAGGLGIRGGTAANDDLILEGTTNATRTTSYVILQPNGGNVGIGTTGPVGKLNVIGSTNGNSTDADNIISGYANNLTQGFAIRLDGLYAVGSNAQVDVKLVSKGSASGIFLGNTAGGSLRVIYNDAVNTIYNGANNIGITADTGHKIFLSQTSNSATGLTVDTTTGNVGIGTTAPQTILSLPVAGVLSWEASAGVVDLGLSRIAAGVIGVGTSGTTSRAGWLNWAGEGRLTSDVTNATAAFANLTGLTITGLAAGRKYFGRLVLKCNNSVAAEGIQLDFNGGTATMTSFWAVASVSAGGATVLGTVISTSLAGVLNLTTITGETLIVIDFSFVVNSVAGGTTIIPRFAENSSTTGTVTAELGSFIWAQDCP